MHALIFCGQKVIFPSRIPQILENARKKSVEGLSIALFFCTILGNLTYGASILMRHPPLDTHFYASTLPYIVGSLGVLMFDLMILGQFVLFSPSPEVASRLGEEEIEP